MSKIPIRISNIDLEVIVDIDEGEVTERVAEILEDINKAKRVFGEATTLEKLAAIVQGKPISIKLIAGGETKRPEVDGAMLPVAMPGDEGKPLGQLSLMSLRALQRLKPPQLLPEHYKMISQMITTKEAEISWEEDEVPFE